MNIIIRTDASSYIGSGHVMRCLVLARGLKEQGHNVSFASRQQQGDLIDFTKNKGFKVYHVKQPKQWLVPKNDCDYSAWLQVSWREDAQSFIQCVERIDLVIVDHYGINKEWEEYVQKRLNCKLFVIDDLIRSHNADLILDQTLLRKETDYYLSPPNTQVLAGCEFSLVAPIFATYKDRVCNNVQSNLTSKILLSMGGVDQPNATYKVLQALKSSSAFPCQVTVLLKSNAPHYQAVKRFSQKNKDWVTHIDFVDNMAQLMTNHTIAIGAPGSTSWERACLGIPSIIIPLADNQKDISQSLVQAHAAIKVALEDIPNELTAAIGELNKNWAKFHKASKSLCDGLGLIRVVTQIEKQFNNFGQIINFRRAKPTDIEKVYQWQSHPKTRQFALNPEVPSWKEHKQWMSTKLKIRCDYFYIIELLSEQLAVGVIRLDKTQKNDYLISVFVSPTFHGLGIAKQALKKIDTCHPSINIHATVLPENLASQKLFVSANYQRVSANTFIRPAII